MDHTTSTGGSIMSAKIVRLVLAASVACLAAGAASAQVTDAEQRANRTATPASQSMPPLRVPGSEADAPELSAPANVFEEAPRDARGKPIGSCAYDPLERQVPAACRRGLEIA